MDTGLDCTSIDGLFGFWGYKVEKPRIIMALEVMLDWRD
jgi:hypothetical protein